MILAQIIKKLLAPSGSEIKALYQGPNTLSSLIILRGDAYMSRLSGFNSPLLLGFDHFERILDQASKTSAEGYPPYNIEQCSENELRITIAVAGFEMADLKLI